MKQLINQQNEKNKLNENSLFNLNGKEKLKHFFQNHSIGDLLNSSSLQLKAAQLLYDSDIRILTNCRTHGIGHLAIEPIWFLAQKQLYPDKFNKHYILLINKGQIANHCLSELLKNHFELSYDLQINELLEKLSRYPSLSIDIGIAPHDGTPHEQSFTIQRNKRHGKMMSDIQRYRKHLSKQFITLPDEIIEEGTKILKSLGIGKDEWFVCLHAGEITTTGQWSYEPFRRNNISSYFEMAKYITACGGKVIRMGHPNLPTLPPKVSLIDYPKSPVYSELMDIFLIHQCKYFIGCQSGLQSVAALFGKPQILTNIIPWAWTIGFDGDIYLPKLIRPKYSKKYLSVNEYIEQKLHLCQFELPDNIEVVPNNTEDLANAVKEMHEYIEQGLPAVKPLQKEWKNRFPSDSQCRYSDIRISFSFIEKHKDILLAVDKKNNCNISTKQTTSSKNKEEAILYSKINPEYKGRNLVFIVGCPRSGTTWLQRLLACHPKIRSGQESDVFDMFIGPQLRAWRSLLNYKLSRRPVGLTSYLRETEYLSALRQYMMNLIEPMIGNLQNDEIFVEKTPSHALYIPEIIEMLPESRIIHILRDVRDVVASLLAASKSWGNYWAPKDAKAATQMWVQHVRAVREAARNIAGSQFFELYYEDLSAATENVLRDLCMFLGLEWDEKGIAAAIENNRLEIAKKTAGTVIPVGGELASLLGPITKEPEGFVRKGRPGSWKEDLSEQELLLISQVAGNTMEEVGYSWNDPEELQSCTKKRMGYYNQMRRIENNVESLVTMIKKLRDDGYLEKAVFDTEQALKKYPCSLDLHNLKAELKIQKGNIKEGKQILLELIKCFPDNIEALNNLGIVSVYEENLNSALEFFKYVLILDPDNKVALENLSHIGEKCSISDNLHFKSSDIISKNIYKNAYPLHNFHNIPKELRQSYYDHTKDPLSNIDYYRVLKDRLVSLNVIVEEREIDINDFEQWLNEFPEIKNHYQNHGDVFIEKCLEHYVTYRYLNISQNDVFIDIAASGSPWAEVLNFRGIKSYRLDMTYPGGFNGINIGADASNSGLPEGFCSALALHCAFECFMGDADIRFAKEASRILKINGRYAIAPLYLEDTYFVSTSPLCDQKNIRIEKEALKVWRDDEYKVPFDRFYSPEAFKQRIYSHIPENMDTRVLYFNNLENLNKYYKGQRIYCFFMFYGKKKW